MKRAETMSRTMAVGAMLCMVGRAARVPAGARAGAPGVPPLAAAAGATARMIVARLPWTQGVALDVGAGDASLARAIARQAQLWMHCVELRPDLVAAARQAICLACAIRGRSNQSAAAGRRRRGRLSAQLANGRPAGHPPGRRVAVARYGPDGDAAAPAMECAPRPGDAQADSSRPRSVHAKRGRGLRHPGDRRCRTGPRRDPRRRDQSGLPRRAPCRRLRHR
jgi:hypothetical protein